MLAMGLLYRTIELRVMACSVFFQVFAPVVAVSAGEYDREFECFWPVRLSQHSVRNHGYRDPDSDLSRDFPGR